MQHEILSSQLEDFFAKCLGVTSIHEIAPKKLIIPYEKKSLKDFLSKVENFDSDIETESSKKSFTKLVDDKVVFTIFLYMLLISHQKPNKLVGIDWVEADKIFRHPKIDIGDFMVLHKKMEKLYQAYKCSVQSLFKGFGIKSFRVFADLRDIALLNGLSSDTWVVSTSQNQIWKDIVKAVTRVEKIDSKAIGRNTFLDWKTDFLPWYNRKVRGGILETVPVEKIASLRIKNAKKIGIEPNFHIKSGWNFVPIVRQNKHQQ